MAERTLNGEPIIRITGLVTRFGPQVIHDNLDLTIERGEVMGIVGGSGTGKSVLLRCIIGLIRPAAGEVEVFGQEVTRLSEADKRAMQEHWGVLFQDGALFSSLTVAQNIDVPLKEHTALPRALRRDLIDLKVAMAGLPPDATNKYPAELSGGMRKRAGLARALALDPEILFLDEPTAGLDPIGAAAFDELIGNLQRALNLTVVMVTHDLDSLYAICDRISVLIDKRVKVGTIESLMREQGGTAEAMETRANYLMVGVFVLALAAGLVVFVIWLAKFEFDTEFARYDIDFKGSVTGLKAGSPVRYSGVRVGEVIEIALIPDSPDAVRITIEIDSGTPIRSDTEATLEIEGLTGGLYVLLSGVSADAPPLRAQPGQKRPVIASKRSTLQQVPTGRTFRARSRT
jgi:phospholipid/cholesterol/gamma-HCH transport system ATP-binding protein